METIKSVWFENERIYMLSSEDKVYNRPLEAFPVLKEASAEEREKFTIEMRGMALRWKELDEDIHISSFYKQEEPNNINEVAAIFTRFPPVECIGDSKEHRNKQKPVIQIYLRDKKAQR